MATMQRKLLTILSFALLVLSAGAQPYCSVKNFNLRDGLASNVVTSLVQTPDQLLWFSTWNGLMCYDGYRFTTLSDTPAGSLQGNRVLSTRRLLNIESSLTGNIWCVTYDLNAYVFDRRLGEFVDITERINRKFGITFHTNRAITLSNGHTWLLNSEKGGAVVCIDDRCYLSDDALRLYRPDDAAFGAHEITWVYADGAGRESLVTDKGVARVDGSFRSDRPYRYLVEMDGLFVMSTVQGEMCVVDSATWHQTPLSVPSTVTQVGALVSGGDRWVIAATNAGFYIYDTRQRSGKLVGVMASLGVLNQTKSMYVDSANRLWVGTDVGDILRVGLADGTVEQLSMGGLTPLLKQSSYTFFHEDQYHTLWAATSMGFLVTTMKVCASSKVVRCGRMPPNHWLSVGSSTVRATSGIRGSTIWQWPVLDAATSHI